MHADHDHPPAVGEHVDVALEVLGADVVQDDVSPSAAGLLAEGETLVSGVHHIDRGYPRFEESLRALGAEVHREPDDSWFE